MEEYCYFYNSYERTTYNVNYFVKSNENSNIYYIYSDDYQVTTYTSEPFYIHDMKFKLDKKLEFMISFTDNDYQILNFLFAIDSPELTSYSGNIYYFPREPHKFVDGYFYYSTSFEVKDPDTGEMTYYEVELEEIVMLCTINGKVKSIRLIPTSEVDANGFITLTY